MFVRAADWKLDQPDWMARLRIIVINNRLIIKFEDKVTGRKTNVFGSCCFFGKFFFFFRFVLLNTLLCHDNQEKLEKCEFVKTQGKPKIVRKLSFEKPL